MLPLVCGAILMTVGACGRKDRAAAPRDPAPVFAASHTAPDLSTPPVSNADAGAEATLLLATAQPDEMARTLLPYLDLLPHAAPDALVTAEANGLRLVRLPLADWPKVAEGLRLTGAAQRLWLADLGEWTELMRGPDRASSRGQVIALDAERLELGPGRLRLLGRCWLTPVPASAAPTADASVGGAAAELRLELLPQLQDLNTTAKQRDEYILEARVKRPIDQGMTFPRLLVQLRSRREAEHAWMYLVIAERPGVDWRDLASPRGESESDDTEGSRPIPAIGQLVRSGDRESNTDNGGSGADAAGPSAAALPTLGEALFGAIPTAQADHGSRSTPRVVLAIVPRSPSEYRLIAPSAAEDPAPGAPANRPR